jgi:putative Holliday junction resolvase
MGILVSLEKERMFESMNMRIMGLDYGTKTIGVAISDPLMFTAQGIETIKRKDENKQRRTLARIEELIIEYGVAEIVLGMPYNMNGTLGERAEKTLAFKEELVRRSGLPVTLWDERLTTYEAESSMIEAGIRREKRKEYIDMIAAILILQDYLNSKESHGKDFIQD